MNIKGQGHSLTFVQGHSDSTFSNFISLETHIPIEANFMWSLHGIGEWKWVQSVYVTWPRWPRVHLWLKIIKKSSSLEKADDFETFLSVRYSSTTKFVQMMTLAWPWSCLWHDQICFLMLLQGWKLTQHIVMYFQACSKTAYPMHLGELYRTNGPLV